MEDNKKWVKKYLNFSDRDLDYDKGVSVGKVIDLVNDYETELKLHLSNITLSISHFIDKNGNTVAINAEGVNTGLTRNGTVVHWIGLGFLGDNIALTPVYDNK